MKFLSLFSGIGGFDLAFMRAGMICDAVCEIDKAAQSVLIRHFPDAKLYDDVRKVGKTTHERKSVNLICGGFPCQDLSIAGKRAGLAGERSVLWFEFARIIDELEPKWVVIENVPGLLSSNGGRDFAVILYSLVECGYGVAWRILDAQYFGVAQRRRRVFIVGSLGDGRAAEVLFEREGVPGDTPPRREAGSKFAADVAEGFVSNGDAHSGFRDERGLVANAISTRPSQRMDTSDNYITWNWQTGGDVRHDFNERGPMLQASQVPAVGVRRLTPIECERLQGFPDGWTDGQSDSARYHQLGNAVAIPVMEWLARRIVEIEGGQDEQETDAGATQGISG